MNRYAIRFTGDGSEYFQIWVSNLVLTIITLGIYSPWAKVRRMRYFYQNTYLADSNFDYHGDPIAILKGRFVAVGVFFLFGLLQNFGWFGNLLALAMGAVALPFLISRSLRFRLRNTSYKNIRFRFLGTAKQAFYYYVVWQAISFVTAFLLFPLAQQAIKDYQIGKSAIGKDQFTFRCGPGPFFRAYYLAFLTGVVFFVLFIIFFRTLIISVVVAKGIGAILAMIILALLAGFTFSVARALVGMLQNDVWNAVEFRAGCFESWVSFKELVNIHFGNVIGLVLTLGLYKPFADIRLAKYRLEHLALATKGDLKDLVASAEKEMSAFGEEVTDVFDIDLAL